MYKRYFSVKRQEALDHHVYIFMVLEIFEYPIPFFFAFDFAAGIVAEKFACFGYVAHGAKMFLFAHYFFDAGKKLLFVPADEFKPPSRGIFYLRFICGVFLF